MGEHPIPQDLAGLEAVVARETVRAALFPSVARARTIGRYVVRHHLGTGAMGLVLAATDPDSGNEVAIKILRSDAGTDSARARLIREAKALGRMDSPHVVRVLDVGTDEDRVFVVMELVEGTALGEWLETEPEPDLRARIQTLLGAARGLAAVHEAGLIHRDFKPDNVLVDASGHARVVDFSLARDQDAESAATGSTWQIMTSPGAVLGTPAYMPAEQFLGAAPDPRTDQFAFCVCLYEALFGVRPFAGDTMEEIRDAVLLGTVALPPAADHLPPAMRAPLEEVLLRGLSRARSKRFPDMSGVLAGLEQALAAG